MQQLRPIDSTDLLRLGSINDGGYLIPRRVIANSHYLISLGYGKNSEFEEDFLRLSHDNKVSCFDSSINVFTLIRDFFMALPVIRQDKRQFAPYKFSQLLNYLSFVFNTRVKYKRREVVGRDPILKSKKLGLDRILDEVVSAEKTLLKMDIEGAEYDCLGLNINSPVLSKINGLIVEFHNVHHRFEDFNHIVSDLQKSHYITHLHINNFGNLSLPFPDVLEITFSHKRFFGEIVEFVTKLPHDLDSPCNPKLSDPTVLFKRDN